LDNGGTRAGAGQKPKTVADASGQSFVFYSKARAKKEMHLANLAELKERAQRGDLVEKTEVSADADFVGRLTRDSFMALPERVASLLVGRTEHEILQELRGEIRDTLQTISDGLNGN
jgi:hypothetical protein